LAVFWLRRDFYDRLKGGRPVDRQKHSQLFCWGHKLPPSLSILLFFFFFGQSANDESKMMTIVIITHCADSGPILHSQRFPVFGIGDADWLFLAKVDADWLIFAKVEADWLVLAKKTPCRAEWLFFA
jgi:hypothetical protein